MKKTKILLTFAVILAIIFQTALFAFAGTTLYFSSSNVELGNNVTVTVKFSGSDIAGVQFNISYDSTVLTYKSCSGGDSASFSGGKVVSYLNSGSTLSYSVSLVFTANAVGSTTVRVTGVGVSDSNGNALGGFDGQAATLSVSSPATAAPAATTAAPAATTKASTASTTKASSPSVTTSAPAGVTAAGETTTTVITNNKVALLDGKEYQFVDDSAFVDPPTGFNETYSDYAGNQILTYTSIDGSQKIVCLMDEQTNKFFALFDDETDTFSDYILLNSANIPLIILKANENDIPSGFTETQITIGDKTITAYESDSFKENGYYLVYALNSQGISGFYRYDKTDGTFQRFDAGSLAVTETTTAELTADDKIPITKVNLLRILCAVGAVLILSLIAVITLAVKLKKRKENVEAEDFFYTMTK